MSPVSRKQVSLLSITAKKSRDKDDVVLCLLRLRQDLRGCFRRSMIYVIIEVQALCLSCVLSTMLARPCYVNRICTNCHQKVCV